jgi:hypothetical protein
MKSESHGKEIYDKDIDNKSDKELICYIFDFPQAIGIEKLYLLELDRRYNERLLELTRVNNKKLLWTGVVIAIITAVITQSCSFLFSWLSFKYL